MITGGEQYENVRHAKKTLPDHRRKFFEIVRRSSRVPVPTSHIRPETSFHSKVLKLKIILIYFLEQT